MCCDGRLESTFDVQAAPKKAAKPADGEKKVVKKPAAKKPAAKKATKVCC